MPGAKVGEAVFELTTDSSKFDKGLVSAEGKTTKLGGALGKVSGVGKILGGVMAGAVVGSLSEFANAAAEDEANAGKLEQAVNNSGVAFEDYAGSIDAAIKKGQALAFSDDATRNGLAALTESTGSVEEAMKRLPIAMDLARAKSITLEKASLLLGKVSDENTKQLKKYGIVMEEGATATELLGKVQQVFGGHAEKYGNSTKGFIDKVHDSVSEFTEGIGASLGPVQGLVALMPGVQSGMLLAGGAVSGISALMKGTMIPSFFATIPATLAMMAPFAPLILIIGAVALAALALKYAWENNLGDIQGKTEAVVTAVSDFFSGLKLFVLEVWRGIVVGVAAAVNGVIGVINGFIKAYNTVADKLGLPLLGEIDLVVPNLADIDRDIDNAARDRTATITTVMRTVYETTQGKLEHRGLVGGPAGYASGTSYVPATGLALVHKGESIIPAGSITARGDHEHPIVIKLDGRTLATVLGDRTNERRRVGGAMA